MTGLALQAVFAQADSPALPNPRFPEAKAQPAPKDCADKSQITEVDGIVTLALTNACRRSTPVSIQADGMKISATFDKDGLAEAAFPLFHDHAEIAWERADGSTMIEPVEFSGFRDTVRIALVWRAHVALALHVVEPGATLASPGGHLRVEQSGANGASLLGAAGFALLDAQPFGTLDVYSLPPGKNPGKGLINYYVEFVSREMTPAGYFCGDGALASPEFEIWILRYGALQKFNHGIAAAPCDKALNDKVKIQRLGDVSLLRN